MPKPETLSTEFLKWSAAQHGYVLIARRRGFDLSRDDQLYLKRAPSELVAKFLLEDVRA